VVTNYHGLKGYLKVLPLTDDVLRYKELDYVYLDKCDLNKFLIEDIKFQKSFILLKLKGINNINEAENYKNSYIKINREYAVKLQEDSFFICDLLECEVFEEIEGHLGKIVDIIQTGSNDVYVVKNEQGNERLIPALKKVVKNVDIKNKKIDIILMEGL
jgi:16S rRNA processing protein RimM